MRCARTTSAATAPGTSNTKTIDELAAGGVRFDQAISAAPWTAPSTTSIVTGMYAHHHGYLHWDAQLDPAIETLLPRVLRARLRGRELRLRHELPLQGPARRRTSSGRARRSTARSSGCARIASSRSSSTSTTGRRTCRTTSSTPTARTGSRRSRRSSTGSSPTRPSALESMREGVPEGGRAAVGGARRVVPRGARDARPAREHGLRVPLRPRRVVGRALRSRRRT